MNPSPTMMLRNSISNTKRFFKKTLKSFKSFFSGSDFETYHKLPKASPYNPQTSSQDLGRNMYTQHFTNNGSPERNENKKKIISVSSSSTDKGKTREDDPNTGERKLLVAQKLKELEMMDMSNVDHALDIQEVLHYYSRLTCPTYLDIVDKFFMDLYAEVLGPLDPPRRVVSRPKYRSVR